MADERKRRRKPTRRSDAPQPTRFSLPLPRGRRDEREPEADEVLASIEQDGASAQEVSDEFAVDVPEAPLEEEARLFPEADGDAYDEGADEPAQATILPFHTASFVPETDGGELSSAEAEDHADDDEPPSVEDLPEDDAAPTLEGDDGEGNGLTDHADAPETTDDEGASDDEAADEADGAAEAEAGNGADADGEALADAADEEPAPEDSDGASSPDGSEGASAPDDSSEGEGKAGLIGRLLAGKDALAKKVDGLVHPDGEKTEAPSQPEPAADKEQGRRTSSAVVYREDVLIERFGELPAARRRTMQSAWDKTIKAFRIILIAGFVLGCLFFLRPSFSKTERRPLATIPEPTWEAISDGSFAEGYASWYSDTYPLRDQIVSLSHLLEGLRGFEAGTQFSGIVRQGDPIPADGQVLPGMVVMPAPDAADDGGPSDVPAIDDSYDASHLNAAIEADIFGDLYVKGDSAYSAYYFSTEAAAAYALAINTAAADIGARANLYSIIVPSSTGVMLSTDDIAAMNGSDERSAINYYYSLYGESVTAVDAYSQLLAYRDEYLYFRTDNHWTARGAYYGYCAFCEAAGIEPNSLDDYQMMTFEGFLGSFYANLGSRSMAANPDTVYAWIPMGTNELTYTGTDGVEVTWAVIQDVSGWTQGSLYSCFAGGDQVWAEIHNPTIHDGSSCVVVKDPYGNAFIPFLVDHYEDVYIADFRYVGVNVADFATANGVQDVIIINGIEYAGNVEAAHRLESIL